MATVAEPELLHREIAPHATVVRRRLARVRSQVRSYVLCQGLAWVVGVATALVVVSYVADRALRLNTSVRLALLPCGLGLIGATIYYRLVRPLRLPLADLDLAQIINARLPGVGERVAGVLQLPDLLRADPHTSPSMIAAAVRRQAQELSRIDWRAPFDTRRMKWRLMAIVGPVVLLAVAAIFWPTIAQLWAKRWLLGSSQRWPQRTYLSIVGLENGDRLYVPRGESILLEVETEPHFSARAAGWTAAGRDDSLAVRQPSPPQSNVPDEIRIRYRQGGSAKMGLMEQLTATRFRYELPAVEEPITFTLTGGDDWLGPVTVEPLNRPGIASLSLVSQSPGRSETDTHSFASQESQLLFLPGTQLELTLESDLPLESADLLPSTGPAPTFARRDERHFVAAWNMTEAQTFEIKLVDAQAHLASKPYFISLNLLQDRLPRVTVRSSGVGRRVTPQATIPVALRAIDDFGLAQVNLDLEQTIPRAEKPEVQHHPHPVALPEESETARPTEFEGDQRVALKDHSVTAGNTVRLRGEATDNRSAGGQVGQSRWLTFQVVTPEELFYDILTVQRAQREKFRGALDVEKAQAALLATPENVEQIAAAGRKHQLVARQVTQIANRLDATLQEMTLNELGSSQARDLLATGIIGPMRDLQQASMSRLRQLIDQIAAEPARQSEMLPAALEQMHEVIDEMTKILDRMAQWESFVDVLNQVRQIMQLQNQVLDSTQKTKTDRTNDLFDDE